MIKVTSLVKKYGEITAVKGLNFEVKEGEIIGFLGPNGAGKTTTLRILTGFIPATDGKAEIAGYDVFENPLEVKRNIGYLPEFPPVYPDLTVKDYLDFVAGIKNVPKHKKKPYTDYVVEKCGLANVFNRRIGELSKGYKQRTGIAQAMIHKPKILFLDEPTSGLDPIQIIEVRNLIKELRQEHTIMLSTHILPEVSATCSKVLIINKGLIVAEDTPENLTEKLKSDNLFEIKIMEEIEKAENTLSNMEKIKKINQKENGVFEIETVDNTSISDIINTLVHSGVKIYSVIPKTATLEEVFLHLTTKEEVK
ncbi:MAG: ABC transporter ATP-binding protein [Candidatus Muiribacteriota bacterium]|jgi:ABC-2 type transport system ATP-binding protein